GRPDERDVRGDLVAVPTSVPKCRDGGGRNARGPDHVEQRPGDRVRRRRRRRPRADDTGVQGGRGPGAAGTSIAHLIGQMTLRTTVTAFGVLAAVTLSSNLNAAKPQRPRPAPPVLTVTPATRLLVVAPHPDDEVLG